METFYGENDLDFSHRYNKEAEKHEGRGKIVKIIAGVIKWTIILFVLLAVAGGIYAGLNYGRFKKIYSLTLSGKESVSSAIGSFRKLDFEGAISQAGDGEASFIAGKEEIDGMREGLAAQIVPYYSAQLESVSYLLDSAASMSRAVGEGAAYVQGMEGMFKDGRPFSELSKEERTAVLAYIHDSDAQMAKLYEDAEKARASLDRITFWGALSFLKPQIDEYAGQVKLASELLKDSAPASRLIPELMGYPEKKSFLFLLQNSDELRSTGGFIGTYGIVDTEAGDITRMETHDIYHIDIPLDKTMNVPPPPPIYEYLNKKWFMRDSNWAPDFPAAAEKALWFYSEENRLQGKEESGSDFDGVIAVTPEFVESLLAYVGPVKIGEETYTAENFSDLLEYKVEKEFVQLGIPRWHRKEVIGDIAKELKAELLGTPLNKWPDVIKLFNTNKARKDILVYMKDEDLQALSKDQGLGGELKGTDGDYLMAVDFNMAALKTDAVMEKSLYYKLEEKPDGLYATVRAGYRNRGTKDWRTSDYKTYTRIYAPEGAELVSSEGVSKGELFKGKEFGKSFFGAYVEVPLGGVGALSVTYKLPQEVKDSVLAGDYSLLLAKQPGNKVKEAAVDFNFLRAVESYQAPDGFDVQRIGDNRLVMKGDLSVDREFEVGF